MSLPTPPGDPSDDSTGHPPLTRRELRRLRQQEQERAAQIATSTGGPEQPGPAPVPIVTDGSDTGTLGSGPAAETQTDDGAASVAATDTLAVGGVSTAVVPDDATQPGTGSSTQPSTDSSTQSGPEPISHAAISSASQPATQPADATGGVSTAVVPDSETREELQAPLVDPLTPSELMTAPPSRAGRNLPVAIGIGLGLGAALLLSLFLQKEVFGLYAMAMIVVACLELRNALQRVRITVPLAPVLLGSAGMLISAFLVGSEGLLVALVITAGATVVWCVLDAPGGRALRNATAAILMLAYIPFLGSFLALALREEDGPWRVLFAICLPVACDVGGYAAGVLWGRHPIAPSVSPKKSWEGLAGSIVLASGVSVWLVIWFFDASWWIGVVLGVVGVFAALVGDLGESLLKRDLGMKDMGSVLPGHGGVLDRVDSILIVAPVAVTLLALLAPA